MFQYVNSLSFFQKYWFNYGLEFEHIEISNTQNLIVFYDTCASVTYIFKNVNGIILHPLIPVIDYLGSNCCKSLDIKADNSLFNNVTFITKTTMETNTVNITNLLSMSSVHILGNSSTKIDQITLGESHRLAVFKSLNIGKLREQFYASGSKRQNKLKKTAVLKMTDIQMNQVININFLALYL